MQFDKHQISAVPPMEYGQRFLKFISKVIRATGAQLSPEDQALQRLPPEEIMKEKVGLRKSSGHEHDANGHAERHVAFGKEKAD